MRRVFLLLAACLLMSLVFAPVAGAQAVGQVLGCDNFASQQDAQITVNQGTGDLSLLDANGNGVACENYDYGNSGPQFGDTRVVNGQLQRFTPDGWSIVGPASTSQNPCTEPGLGAHGFDGPDADCVAEDLETPQNTGGTAQPVQQTQQSAKMQNLPDTGGPPLSGIAAGAGALLIAGGLLLKRRLT